MEKWLCGVDLGGTKLAVVLTDEQGKIKDKTVVYDHVRRTDHDMVRYIADLINNLLAVNSLQETNLHGIGVCFPGHIRFQEGMTITTSNLIGFKNFPLKQALQEHFRTHVVVDNDANAQTYAEFKYGAGRGYKNMLFMTISSGIGGGIVIDKKLYRGLTGTAGEFGHIIVDPQSTIQCGCGNYGCLMGCASGLSLPQIFQKYLVQGVKTELEIDHPAEIDGKMIKLGLDRHDTLCERIMAEYARYIGIGVYNLFQIFNPPVIVLGGGLMKWGPAFLQQIQATFTTFAKDMVYDPMAIVLSELGDNAGAIGIAALLLADHE